VSSIKRGKKLTLQELPEGGHASKEKVPTKKHLKRKVRCRPYQQRGIKIKKNGRG